MLRMLTLSMASRRVENVGLAILTFCTKREYIPFCA